MRVAPAGSVVALYAAQPFEETPELPRPGGAKRSPEHYFGLLSYTVNQVMEQRRSPISYRELMRLVMASYCSERGTRGPTPFAEGDLDAAGGRLLVDFDAEARKFLFPQNAHLAG